MPKVVVGIVIIKECNCSEDCVGENCVLLCQRLKNARYALKWEFPGGKIELNEQPEEALIRELREELNITVTAFEHYSYRENRYPDGAIFEVDFFMVKEFSGDVENKAFEQIRWVAIRDLDRYEILQGNAEVVQKLIREYAEG